MAEQLEESSKWGPVLAWIRSVISQPIPDDPHEALNSGVALCQLLNKIKPNIVPPLSGGLKGKKMTMTYMANIQVFLTGCWHIGVSSRYMFTPTELYKKTQMHKVLRCLCAVSLIARGIGFSGPTLELPTFHPDRVTSINTGRRVAKSVGAKSASDDGVFALRSEVIELRAKTHQLEATVRNHNQLS